MKKQLSHSQSIFSLKKFPIVLILDNVTGEANLGSIFRLADAFNIEKIAFCGYTPNLKSNRLKRTSRNTHETVNFEVWEDSMEAIKFYKENEYSLYSLEITSESVAIDSIGYHKESRLALVLGNEANGINENILKQSDKTLHINMYGLNSSMNVAQAAGIALFEISKSLRSFDKK